MAKTEETCDDQDSYILAALARPAPIQHPSSQFSQDSARSLLFSTTDLWRHGGFAHGGVLWAPSGLDQEAQSAARRSVRRTARQLPWCAHRFRALVSTERYDDDCRRRISVYRRPSYNVPTAAGLRTFDAFYVGPEVQAFGAADNYHQLRAGLHVTGFRTGEFEWSVGAGWATDTDERNSAYGKLSVWARR